MSANIKNRESYLNKRYQWFKVDLDEEEDDEHGTRAVAILNELTEKNFIPIWKLNERDERDVRRLSFDKLAKVRTSPQPESKPEPKLTTRMYKTTFDVQANGQLNLIDRILGRIDQVELNVFGEAEPQSQTSAHQPKGYLYDSPSHADVINWRNGTSKLFPVTVNKPVSFIRDAKELLTKGRANGGFSQLDAKVKLNPPDEATAKRSHSVEQQSKNTPWLDHLRSQSSQPKKIVNNENLNPNSVNTPLPKRAVSDVRPFAEHVNSVETKKLEKVLPLIESEKPKPVQEPLTLLVLENANTVRSSIECGKTTTATTTSTISPMASEFKKTRPSQLNVPILEPVVGMAVGTGVVPPPPPPPPPDLLKPPDPILKSTNIQSKQQQRNASSLQDSIIDSLNKLLKENSDKAGGSLKPSDLFKSKSRDKIRPLASDIFKHGQAIPSPEKGKNTSPTDSALKKTDSRSSLSKIKSPSKTIIHYYTTGTKDNDQSDRDKMAIPDYDYSMSPEDILKQSDRDFDYSRYVNDWVRPYSCHKLLLEKSTNINCPFTVTSAPSGSNLVNSLDLVDNYETRKLCLNVYAEDEHETKRTTQPIVYACRKAAESPDSSRSTNFDNITLKVYFDVESLAMKKLNKLKQKQQQPAQVDLKVKLKDQSQTAVPKNQSKVRFELKVTPESSSQSSLEEIPSPKSSPKTVRIQVPKVMSATQTDSVSNVVKSTSTSSPPLMISVIPSSVLSTPTTQAATISTQTEQAKVKSTSSSTSSPPPLVKSPLTIVTATQTMPMATRTRGSSTLSPPPLTRNPLAANNSPRSSKLLSAQSSASPQRASYRPLQVETSLSPITSPKESPPAPVIKPESPAKRNIPPAPPLLMPEMLNSPSSMPTMPAFIPSQSILKPVSRRVDPAPNLISKSSVQLDKQAELIRSLEERFKNSSFRLNKPRQRSELDLKSRPVEPPNKYDQFLDEIRNFQFDKSNNSKRKSMSSRDLAWQTSERPSSQQQLPTNRKLNDDQLDQPGRTLNDSMSRSKTSKIAKSESNLSGEGDKETSEQDIKSPTKDDGKQPAMLDKSESKSYTDFGLYSKKKTFSELARIALTRKQSESRVNKQISYYQQKIDSASTPYVSQQTMFSASACLNNSKDNLLNDDDEVENLESEIIDETLIDEALGTTMDGTDLTRFAEILDTSLNNVRKENEVETNLNKPTQIAQEQSKPEAEKVKSNSQMEQKEGYQTQKSISSTDDDDYVSVTSRLKSTSTKQSDRLNESRDPINTDSSQSSPSKQTEMFSVDESPTRTISSAEYKSTLSLNRRDEPAVEIESETKRNLSRKNSDLLDKILLNYDNNDTEDNNAVRKDKNPIFDEPSVIYMGKYERENFGEKLEKSEKMLDDARSFIEKIQEKRKKLQSIGSDESNDTRTIKDDEMTDSSTRKSSRVNPEALEIYNRLKNDRGDPVRRSLITNDPLFEIQPVESNINKPALPITQRQDVSYDDDTTMMDDSAAATVNQTASAADSYFKRAISNGDVNASSFGQPKEKKRFLARLLPKQEKQSKDEATNKTRKNIIKNIFKR